jgi:hypothetical protein
MKDILERMLKEVVAVFYSIAKYLPAFNKENNTKLARIYDLCF